MKYLTNLDLVNIDTLARLKERLNNVDLMENSLESESYKDRFLYLKLYRGNDMISEITLEPEIKNCEGEDFRNSIANEIGKLRAAFEKEIFDLLHK